MQQPSPALPAHPMACSSRLPPLQLFNATAAEDLVVKTNAAGVPYVGGAVTNWTLVSLNHDTQMCMVRRATQCGRGLAAPVGTTRIAAETRVYSTVLTRAPAHRAAGGAAMPRMLTAARTMPLPDRTLTSLRARSWCPGQRSKAK